MEFDFSKRVTETGWLVKDLIPIGHLCIVLSQAGIGKSLFVEGLGTHVVCGKKFCGFDTVSGDVLIIDQDTPQNVLESRLIRFSKSMGTGPIHKMFVESMRGYLLDDKTIYAPIKDHRTVKLAVIDSLHSILGRLNPNSTADMNRIAILKQHCLREDMTIIINHHISEKAIADIDTLMTADPHRLAMGNSAIIQQADSYFIVGAQAENGRTCRLYFRPVSKRASIPTGPTIMRIIMTQSGGEAIEYDGPYIPGLDGAEQDTLVLFQESPKERTVKEVYEDMGHRHGEKATRDALAKLDAQGLLVMSKGKSNLFKYKLPE